MVPVAAERWCDKAKTVCSHLPEMGGAGRTPQQAAPAFQLAVTSRSWISAAEGDDRYEVGAKRWRGWGEQGANIWRAVRERRCKH